MKKWTEVRPERLEELMASFEEVCAALQHLTSNKAYYQRALADSSLLHEVLRQLTVDKAKLLVLIDSFNANRRQ